MRILLPVITAITISLSGCRTPKPSPADSTVSIGTEPSATEVYKKYSDPTTWLLGYFQIGRMHQPPHSEWFIKGFDEYKPDEGAVNRLKELLTPQVSMKIVIGTWCPDSRREVPRFMRIMESAGFDRTKIEFIGVDNVKFSPVENYESLKIERVPTFIVYKNFVEAGRIIENPTTSLEQDMVNILTRNEK